MKWKDSDEKVDREEEEPQEDYFDEEQFSPWSDQKNPKKVFRYGKTSLLYFLLAVGIIASVTALVMLLVGGNGQRAAQQRYTLLEERIRQLEERLDKYEAIDEKVTRIWEQAKSFEKFKDRFDRSEASISLRMDHLTMALENLQKRDNAKIKTPEPQVAAEPASQQSPVEPEKAIQYHQVLAKETFYSISRKYNLSLDELLELNHMTLEDVIVPGQKLIIRKSPAE